MTTIRRLFSRTTGRAIVPAMLRAARRALFLASTAVALTACGSTFGVYNPADAPGAPNGTIAPLSTYLPPGVTDVKLVFIHGVGDHCPGYALSGADDSGWLSVERAARLGLTPLDAQPVTHPRIYSAEFLPGAGGNVHQLDRESYVAVRTQRFEYGKTGAVVEAVEITWSPLTQWVKNHALEDDYTGKHIVTCADDTKENANRAVEALSRLPDPAAQPPARVPLNRLLKESVLDRNLADAGLYMGQYRSAMQLGLADALCHSLTGQESASDPTQTAGRPCRWKLSPADLNTRYLFVTHSLGSRMLYDTLLGLLGYTTAGVDQKLFAAQSPDSQVFTANMMKNTPVVYMMANQLAFLGLGNMPIDAVSSAPEGQRALALPPTVESLHTHQLLGQKSSPIEITRATQPLLDTCDGNDPCRLGLLKNVTVASKDNTPAATCPTLDMIAFSDTNDLLSWSVPRWYQQQVAGPDGVQTTPVRFVNVYVKNATHWLGLAESPLPAHGNYFVNADVLQAIHCGAKSATINDCPAAQ